MGQYSAVSRDCCAFRVPLECDRATEGTESTEELEGDQLIEQIIAAAIEVQRLPCTYSWNPSLKSGDYRIEIPQPLAKGFQGPNAFVVESNTSEAGSVDERW